MCFTSAEVPRLHLDPGAEPQIRNVDVAHLPQGGIALSGIGAAARARLVAAAERHRKSLVTLADAAQEGGMIDEAVGDEMDDVALALHLALAFDHPRRQHD